MRVLPILLLLGFASLTACRSTPPRESGLHLDPAPPPARAWTTAFLHPAVLVADEITIEGPFDLIDHVALRQDEETCVYRTETVREGLLQELSARPEMGVDVRAQLDGWALAALRKITVLQRPGEVPVKVRAVGNAYWAAGDGSAERRENELVFQGTGGR